MSLLEVRDLGVQFATPGGTVHAVDGVSFTMAAGEAVGLVGESGSGKSATALSLAGLLGPASVRGTVRFAGRELLGLDAATLRTIRGGELATIFQDPATSLNPVMDVVGQVAEMFRTHQRLDRSGARARAIETLRTVGVGDSAGRYPHQLSGGMRQRVMIAMAVACEPRLLVADEPTTALDVTVQAQILQLVADLVRRRATSLLLISHDLGVIAGMTSRVMVMYAGQIMESAPTDRLFAAPRHPYTIGLLESVPRLDQPPARRLAAVAGEPPHSAGRAQGCPFAPRCPRASTRCVTEPPRLEPIGDGQFSACWHPVVQPEPTTGSTTVTAANPAGPDDRANGSRVARPAKPPPPVGAPVAAAREVVVARGVTVDIRAGRRVMLRPVDRVDIMIREGETLGLVGESGCGKSTLGRALLMLQRPTSGSVRVAGLDWQTLRGTALRRSRRHAQLVFQDPHASFDPRVTVRAALAEPLALHHVGSRSAHVDELLARVHLDPGIGAKLPHECSGGQLQRVALARALAASPAFLVADEPTSALDVSIQAQMMNLMCDLQERDGLAYLFVSHNLAVVRQVSHRVAVMYLGRIVELADRDTLFAAPLHPYTRALISAVPHPDPPRERRRERLVLAGDVPTLSDPPRGCHFHPRCPAAMEVCRNVAPAWVERPDGHRVACHLYPAGER